MRLWSWCEEEGKPIKQEKIFDHQRGLTPEKRHICQWGLGSSLHLIYGAWTRKQKIAMFTAAAEDCR